MILSIRKPQNINISEVFIFAKIFNFSFLSIICPLLCKFYASFATCGLLRKRFSKASAATASASLMAWV